MQLSYCAAILNESSLGDFSFENSPHLVMISQPDLVGEEAVRMLKGEQGFLKYQCFIVNVLLML